MLTVVTNGVWASRLKFYIANEDPLVQAANTIALLVASNQPFYPLYLYWLVSDNVLPSLLTFLSTPFFAIIPAVTKKRPLAGKMLLVIVGIANTVLCAKLFGVQSAVETFLFPCLLLSILPFRAAERAFSILLVGVVFAAFMVLHGRYGAASVNYSAAEYAALVKLNAASAGALTAMIAFGFAGALLRSDRSPEKRASLES